MGYEAGLGRSLGNFDPTRNNPASSQVGFGQVLQTLGQPRVDPKTQVGIRGVETPGDSLVNLNLASASPTTAVRNLIKTLMNSDPQVGTLIIPTLPCIKAGVLPASLAELTGHSSLNSPATSSSSTTQTPFDSATHQQIVPPTLST
ncbi:hypothetical protein PGTUg99_036285 [Puccinia graminis f. sp. tritici]|uniref:Uncharacterized protein n=1 Tax=Puccinia graminis f. sp. tritici TaxID=56615 RepID=A0A5B0RN94_PUCGR|nr:hypothetical protein PGTUg99_036285 [Puccinia graminis f. sp. tritici]